MATFERDGLSLWYSVSGSGRPVILHTGAGGDSDMFASAGYVEALVSCGYRVVCFDHRGHGRSDTPLRRADHRTTEYVDDVVALLDALELPDAAVVGYSQGMAIAFALAAAYPERVAAVVGIGAVGVADDPSDWRMEVAAAVRENGTVDTIRAMAEVEREPPPAWLLENLSTTDPEVLALAIEAPLDDDVELWEHFPRVRVPALLVVGECEEDEEGMEPGLAARNAQEAARRMPEGTSHSLPGLAHLAAFWRSDLTIPAILTFLQRWYAPKTGSVRDA